MFKEIFIRLCNDRGVSPCSVCQAIGINKSSFSQWSDTTIPRRTTLLKLADYFGVTPDYLLNGGTDTLTPAATVSPLGTITPDEISLVLAWRSHPEYHDALRKMLDMPMPEAKKDTTA